MIAALEDEFLTMASYHAVANKPRTLHAQSFSRGNAIVVRCEGSRRACPHRHLRGRRCDRLVSASHHLAAQDDGAGRAAPATRRAMSSGSRREAASWLSPAVVGALSFVYDHRERESAKRLTGSFHDRHDLWVASMHVHLDHDSCLEVAVLRGAMRDVRDFARHIVAERGVRHGRLVMVPVEFEDQTHAHGAETSRHLHTHVIEAR